MAVLLPLLPQLLPYSRVVFFGLYAYCCTSRSCRMPKVIGPASTRKIYQQEWVQVLVSIDVVVICTTPFYQPLSKGRRFPLCTCALDVYSGNIYASKRFKNSSPPTPSSFASTHVWHISPARQAVMMWQQNLFFACV